MTIDQAERILKETRHKALPAQTTAIRVGIQRKLKENLVENMRDLKFRERKTNQKLMNRVIRYPSLNRYLTETNQDYGLADNEQQHNSNINKLSPFVFNSRAQINSI